MYRCYLYLLLLLEPDYVKLNLLRSEWVNEVWVHNGGAIYKYVLKWFYFSKSFLLISTSLNSLYIIFVLLHLYASHKWEDCKSCRNIKQGKRLKVDRKGFWSKFQSKHSMQCMQNREQTSICMWLYFGLVRISKTSFWLLCTLVCKW